MAKRWSALVLAGCLMVAASGCAAGGGDFFYRAWKHLEWHVEGAYQDLTHLHRDIDKYIFNLDDRNPDRY